MDTEERGGRHRPPAWTRGRWALGVGAGLGTAAIVTAVALTAGPGAACAAPSLRGAAQGGQATHYELTSGGGNCSYPGPPEDGLYAALSPGEYDQAAACGGYLDVTGPRGTVRVKVVDQCPECANGHIDLSREAFARIADPVQGIVPVSYEPVVNPSVPGPLGFRIKEGASQYWFAVLVLDHGNPLATVEARGPGGPWRSLVRQDYNYWLAEEGLGPGPYQLRVTDVHGQQVTADAVALAPERVQTTTTTLYGQGAAAPPRRDPPAASAPDPGEAERPSGSAPPAEPSEDPPTGQPSPTATAATAAVAASRSPAAGEAAGPSSCG